METRTSRRGVPFTSIGFGSAPLGNLFREVTDDEARGAVDAA
ncbi:MAG: D-threo-aldose 1-dehydrogenase, partial [Microbacteriaceae bacterium]|nr:D-threo-aldose 1-dehydrogenase [Microbacteriaceae bacterium]